MFLEGASAPRSMVRREIAAQKTNGLLENVKKAIDALWKQRGYNPKKPALTKERLGYALDKEEAVGYVVTGVMNLPRLSPDEARAFGKRVVSIVSDSGTVGAKVKALRKRGTVAAGEIAQLLRAEVALSLAPPEHKGSGKRPRPEPSQPQPQLLASLVPPGQQEQLCARTRAEVAAATPLQKLYGMPDPGAWGPDDAEVPDDPQPTSPNAVTKARRYLERLRHSKEVARAIIAVDQLENAYMLLDDRLARPEHLGRESEADVRDAIEVETVRYRQALRKLQVALPGEVPEIVLEPQLANEQNSMPCPYGFGRLVRKPWALHVPPLGFCQHECWCGALLRARDEIVVASGVGWTGLPVDGSRRQ